MGKTATYFTRAAVQRAMDRRAARWGAPAGYYAVDARDSRSRGTSTQIWHVAVRLFGGRQRHITPVIFRMTAGGPEYIGPITPEPTLPGVTAPGETPTEGTTRKA